MSDVTRILSQIEEGDPQAAEKLLPLVYEELRKLAAVKLAQENPGQTLQATALVHEAYLRLVGGGKEPRTKEPKNQEGAGDRGQESETQHPHPDPLPEGERGRRRYKDRGHFFASAATAMRRILVDNARARLTDKRGGGLARQPLADVVAPLPDEQLVALEEAL